MQWHEIVRLVMAILRILDMIPPEKRREAEKGAFGAVAKIMTEDNIT